MLSPEVSFIYVYIFEREWEKHQSVVPLNYVFIDWFLYVSQPGIKPTTLGYQDGAPTNWAI